MMLRISWLPVISTSVDGAPLAPSPTLDTETEWANRRLVEFRAALGDNLDVRTHCEPSDDLAGSIVRFARKHGIRRHQGEE